MGGMAARLDVSANCEVAHATEQGQDVHSGLTCSLQPMTFRCISQELLFASVQVGRAFSPLFACPQPSSEPGSERVRSPPLCTSPIHTSGESIAQGRRPCTVSRNSTPCTCCRRNAEQSWGWSPALTRSMAHPSNPHIRGIPGSPDASTTRTRASSGRMSSRRSERSSRSKSESRSARSRLPNGGICRLHPALRAQTATTTMLWLPSSTARCVFSFSPCSLLACCRPLALAACRAGPRQPGPGRPRRHGTAQLTSRIPL